MARLQIQETRLERLEQAVATLGSAQQALQARQVAPETLEGMRREVRQMRATLDKLRHQQRQQQQAAAAPRPAPAVTAAATEGAAVATAEPAAAEAEAIVSEEPAIEAGEELADADIVVAAVQAEVQEAAVPADADGQESAQPE